MSNAEDPIKFTVPTRSVSDRKKKLGKGLGALLGETRREEPLIQTSDSSLDKNTVKSIASTEGGLANLPISSISPMPGQPRKRFEEDALQELASSISARGVIQPIIVRKIGEGRFQIVAGERRWRAAQKARLHEIPALVRDLDDREVMALALIENIQREDLNPVEEARAYQNLSSQEGMTQVEIAQMVEKSRSHIANLQRLLQLPEDVLGMVENSSLSMGHARALIGYESASELARRAVNDNLSVREVENLVRTAAAPEKSPKKAALRRGHSEDADIAAVQAHLEEFLGMNVRISTGADPRTGSVTIKYSTLDQLDLICQKLTGADI